MKPNNLSKTLTGLALCVLLTSCLVGPQSKRGSVVDNELVVGFIYTASGDPAVNARVRIIPVGHIPDTSGAGEDSLESTLTNASGEYAVGSLPEGEYNILADLTGQYAIQDSVYLSGSAKSIPGDTLDLPGSVSGRVEVTVPVPY